MTSGRQDSEPEGVTGDCFYILAMYERPGGITAEALHECITAENTALGLSSPSIGDVRASLTALADKRRQPLIERAGPPLAGIPSSWHISAYGRSRLRDWCGPLDDHVPCGLGWPGAAPVAPLVVRRMINRFSDSNAARTSTAAGRDRAIAAAALQATHPDWPPAWLVVAKARLDLPSASWREVAASIGMTKDAAVGIFRRLRLQMEGSQP